VKQTGYNSDIHHRRSIRLKGFNYATPGAFFVTVCTQERQCLFGEISAGKIRLSDQGRMLHDAWDELPTRFPFIELDQFVVMPNHVHGIIVLTNSTSGRSTADGSSQGDHKDRPDGTGTLGRVVQAFKSTTTHEYILGVRQHGWLPFPGKLWQRNYYERVIRNEEELQRVREYISNNPLTWETDEENPSVQKPS